MHPPIMPPPHGAVLRRPAAPDGVRELVTTLWLVAETAGPFREAIDDSTIDATRLTRAVLAPVLTAAGRTALGLDEEEP